MNGAKKWLHQAGIIQLFNEGTTTEELEWVVIDPSFMVGMMKCIISLRNVIIKDGIFTTKDTSQIFYPLLSSFPEYHSQGN